MYGMLCVLFGVAVWLILATLYGLPVSTTHSCIGGIIGMAIVSKGWNAVNWKKVGLVASSWIAAPVICLLLSLLSSVREFFVLATVSTVPYVRIHLLWALQLHSISSLFSIRVSP